jgi:hypothetical protein
LKEQESLGAHSADAASKVGSEYRFATWQMGADKKTGRRKKINENGKKN